MKIVIDISENQYEVVKEYIETVDDKSPLAKAIANGTPYETVTEFADRCRECGREKVLDKIRAEIADLDDADYDYEGYYKAVTDAVKIIDKYRVKK